MCIQAVKRFMKLECKCHGVSGSCTLRTCWMAMSDFRKTGDYLRRKYNGAIEVTMNQDGTGFAVANKAFRKATKNDLVYFENSPDYCLQDKAAGKTADRGSLTGFKGCVSHGCWWIAQTVLCVCCVYIHAWLLCLCVSAPVCVMVDTAALLCDVCGN